MTRSIKQPINVATGEFPYPILSGPTESRYLTWIRNHSNYMAERGFLDYFRLVAVLLRGIVVNLLTLLPYVLLAATLLGFAYQGLLIDWEKQAKQDSTALKQASQDSTALKQASQDSTALKQASQDSTALKQASQDSTAFLTKMVVEDTSWVSRLQDKVFVKKAHTLDFGGDWKVGDKFVTKLTREGQSESESVETNYVEDKKNDKDKKSVKDKKNRELLRDRHLSELQSAGKLFSGFEWKAKSSDIEAIPVADAKYRTTITVQGNNFVYHYEPSAPTPYLLTFLAVALFAGYIMLFPVFTRLFKVIAYRRALATGSSSSVKTRDRFERTFGFLLLLVFVVALIESLPLLAHYFHQFQIGDSGFVFPAGAGALLALVAGNQSLPFLGGWVKKLVILMVAALGLLIPLLAVIVVVEFLVYTDPYRGSLVGAFLLLPVAIAVLIVITGLVGFRSFTLRGFGILLSLIGAMALLAVINVGLKMFDQSFGEYWNFVFVLAWAVEAWIVSTLAVDINLTSINGLYRDRLASAFLVGANTEGDVDIEQDIDLQEICHYGAGSTAPYHLVNVALNLQGSKDIAIRERNSDFFIFSKRFIGSERTGYCESEHMEQVFPQVDLGTAMAISAAAASPNMGRGTNPLMVAFMTLLNVRLGFWVPNPYKLEETLAGQKDDFSPPGFKDIFKVELLEIQRRREQAYKNKTQRPLDLNQPPTIAHNLVGIGFSGGGIRSATVNLGIAQALHSSGVFDHIDYMSTVSGGGYLGSSISTLMRYKYNPVSEIDGTVSVETTAQGEKVVTVRGSGADQPPVYRYSSYAELNDNIVNGATVKAGQLLLKRNAGSGPPRTTLMDRFKWRVRPIALLREMLSMLDETSKWVNLSDGGHIENLATIELLRRRCRFIIIGDGEADPQLYFNGLATLMRYARIDLGIEIEINLEKLRLGGSEKDTDRCSTEHFAFGRIIYPDEKECGYLLYLKSSFTGNEEEVITEYRHNSPDFPHESTADQFFDEGQFEAYRSLGQHIAEDALCNLVPPAAGKPLPFEELKAWFKKNTESDGAKS